MKKGGVMNKTRMNSLLSGLPSVTRKVFDAVPILEQWTRTMIHAEMIRCGISVEVRVVEGSLVALKRAKLICEPDPGRFARCEVKEDVPVRKEKPAAAVAAPVEKKPLEKAPEPITSRLSAIVARVRQAHKVLGDLAGDLEMAMLEIDERANETADDLQKLQKFKELISVLR